MKGVRNKRDAVLFFTALALSFILLTTAAVLSVKNFSTGNIEYKPSGDVSLLKEYNGLIYAGSVDNNLSIFAADGTPLNIINVGGTIKDILVVDQYLFVASENKKVSIFDSSFNIVNEILFKEMIPTLIGVNNDHLFVFLRAGSSEGALYQYNWMTGIREKSIDFPYSVIEGMTVLKSGNLLTVNSHSEIIIYDENLAPAAELTIDFSPKYTAAYEEKLFVLDGAHNFYTIESDLSYTVHHFGAKTNSTGIFAGKSGGVIFFGGEIKGADGQKIATIKGLSHAYQSGETFYLYAGDGIFISNLSTLKSFNLAKTMSLAGFIAGGLTIVVALFFAVRPFYFFTSFLSKSTAVAKKIGRDKFIYLAILPTFLLMFVFGYFPAIFALVLSFNEYKIGQPMSFVGIANYLNVFNNPLFWGGFKNTAIFLVTDLLKAVVPPLIIAELIICVFSKRLQYFIRLFLYVPAILPGLAALLVWKYGIFGYEGVINNFLANFGVAPKFWLGHPDTALLTLLLIGFPWVGSYLIVYGALISVPSSLYEASELDGCGRLRRIISIDIPLIFPQLKYLFIMAFIASFQNYGVIFMATKGGPNNATNTIGYVMYKQMNEINNYGNASAIGVLLFILIFAATFFSVRSNKRSIE